MHAILYRSRERPGLLASDLNDIVETAQVRNRQLDVTGLLLSGHLEVLPAAPGEFVQWIEGPEDRVESLFRSIERDARHTEVDVLGRGAVAALVDASSVEMVPGTDRLFPAWSMGLVRLAELPATLGGFLRFTATWDGQAFTQAA